VNAEDGTRGDHSHGSRLPGGACRCEPALGVQARLVEGVLFSCWPSLRRCWSRAFLRLQTTVWCNGTRKCSAHFDTDALPYRASRNLPRRQDLAGGGIDDTSSTVQIRITGTRCFNRFRSPRSKPGLVRPWIPALPGIAGVTFSV
jgi:hypothetical protein